jgi:hypothetical protein
VIDFYDHLPFIRLFYVNAYENLSAILNAWFDDENKFILLSEAGLTVLH